MKNVKSIRCSFEKNCESYGKSSIRSSMTSNKDRHDLFQLSGPRCCLRCWWISKSQSLKYKTGIRVKRPWHCILLQLVKKSQNAALLMQSMPLISLCKRLGVDTDNLLSQPDTGEQGLEIADALVSSGRLIWL